eukprot:TRINITY_DN3316_c0_g1_i2.p1 TRINITY_DN3316_c0_g1~~TRINITY_DN3316_c0_g1_i2.p1  ORF type:complete len:854 (-),score=263.90 TRINITY_DN3316_c0_g1_i2:29-2590(-)
MSFCQQDITPVGLTDDHVTLTRGPLAGIDDDMQDTKRFMFTATPRAPLSLASGMDEDEGDDGDDDLGYDDDEDDEDDGDGDYRMDSSHDDSMNTSVAADASALVPLPASPSDTNEYEQKRLKNIERNKQLLLTLGLGDAREDLRVSAERVRTPSSTKRTNKLNSARQRRESISEDMKRKSQRLKGKEYNFGPRVWKVEGRDSGKGDHHHHDGGSLADFIDEGEVFDEDDEKKKRPKSGIKYSTEITTCHMCEVRDRSRKTTCANCHVEYWWGQICRHCLETHYGITLESVLGDPTWTCYVCRDACVCIPCKAGARVKGRRQEKCIKKPLIVTSHDHPLADAVLMLPLMLMPPPAHHDDHDSHSSTTHPSTPILSSSSSFSSSSQAINGTAPSPPLSSSSSSISVSTQSSGPVIHLVPIIKPRRGGPRKKDPTWEMFPLMQQVVIQIPETPPPLALPAPPLLEPAQVDSGRLLVSPKLVPVPHQDNSGAGAAEPLGFSTPKKAANNNNKGKPKPKIREAPSTGIKQAPPPSLLDDTDGLSMTLPKKAGRRSGFYAKGTAAALTAPKATPTTTMGVPHMPSSSSSKRGRKPAATPTHAAPVTQSSSTPTASATATTPAGVATTTTTNKRKLAGAADILPAAPLGSGVVSNRPIRAVRVKTSTPPLPSPPVLPTRPSSAPTRGKGGKKKGPGRPPAVAVGRFVTAGKKVRPLAHTPTPLSPYTTPPPPASAQQRRHPAPLSVVFPLSSSSSSSASSSYSSSTMTRPDSDSLFSPLPDLPLTQHDNLFATPTHHHHHHHHHSHHSPAQQQQDNDDGVVLGMLEMHDLDHHHHHHNHDDDEVGGCPGPGIESPSMLLA